MANASVEKLKALGLRHGEKAVMGLAATLSVMCLFMALTRPTIQTTPAEVAKAAEQAQSNLAREQKTEDILERLKDSGIKDPNFESQVDNQAKNKLSSLAFKVTSPWATPEPGAGLIRDTPVLIAPTELVAYPGRGGLVIYELKDGERIPETPEDAAAEEKNLSAKRASRRKNRRAAMSSGMAGMMGPALSPAQKARMQKEFERKQQMVKKAMSGEDKAKATEKAEPEKEQGPFKETTKGFRWVAITGVLDYKTLRDNYLTALKSATVAYPYFKGLGVERQSLGSDGTWSDWEAVDAEKNAEVINNLPEEDDEWVPEPVRLNHLVDPLPFLKSGYWEKVHVASLVPKEKKEVQKPQLNIGAMMGGSGMMQEQMMMREQMMASAGSAEYGASMGGSASMRMGMGMGMEGMGGGAGAVEDMSFPKNEEPTLMIRSLDFTVDPDTTYRFRVQIIVRNPNRGRGDVSPGVNTADEELKGPFSDPTEPVTVPPDVATYAMEKVQAVGQNDQVKFQVTRWDPDKGFMVVKNFDAGPGDIIGEYGVTDVPTSEGKGVDKRRVDFNSHQVVLDAMGGSKPVPAEIDNGRFDVPALSLVVRNDGTVVVRNEVIDQNDEVRKSVDENYKREKKESTKKRETSSMYGGSAAAGGY